MFKPDLVSGELSDLDDLHSELHEQRLQDHALLFPVLLAHGLLPLCHAALENTHTQTTHIKPEAKSVYVLMQKASFSYGKIFVSFPPLHREPGSWGATTAFTACRIFVNPYLRLCFQK